MGAQRCKRFVIMLIIRIQGRNQTAGGLPCSSNRNQSAGDQGSIPGLGRSSGEGNGNLLQYSCLENSMDREAWRATVRGVAKSQTRLSESHTHTHTHTHSQTAGGLLRSGDYQANGGRHGEEKMFVAVLSLNPKKLGRQVRNV